MDNTVCQTSPAILGLLNIGVSYKRHKIVLILELILLMYFLSEWQFPSHNQVPKLRMFNRKKEKSRIRETMNLSTDADHRTDIFFWGGDGKKNKNKKCDT